MIRLASTSQTRALLLKQFGIDFIQQSSDFDEDSIDIKDPKEFVYQATKGKFEAALQQYGVQDYPLLVADTVITANNQLLRKAKDEDDAYRIFKLQSGSKVSIITCMIYKSNSKQIIDISYTDYQFRVFEQKDIENYIKSKEWIGKAGACMVEGFCQPYIESVHGLESTAMGLSVEKLLSFL